jgi:hypothetical protein
MVIFKKQGFICDVKRDKNELDDHFMTRGIFVVSQKPKSLNEYNMVILYSRCYINVKYNKCQYSVGVMDILKNMEDTMYSQ